MTRGLLLILSCILLIACVIGFKWRKKRLAILIRGHVRDTFTNQEMADFMGWLVSKYNADIYIHTWANQEGVYSWRPLSSHNYKVDENMILTYFDKVRSNIKNIHIENEPDTGGEESSKICLSNMPRIGWKRMWHGVYNGVETIPDRYEHILNIRFDFFGSYKIKNNLQTCPVYTLSHVKNIVSRHLLHNNNSVSFATDGHYPGIDNFYIGRAGKIRKLVKMFHTDLDDIETRFCQNKQNHEYLVVDVAQII